MVIYRIYNTTTQHAYIGQTTRTNPQQRWWIHRSLLRNGRHINIHLQRAWNKYGESAFLFEVLTTCEDQYSLDLVERFAIHQQGHYNIDEGGQGIGSRSEETKRKISASRKGLPFSQTHRENLRIAARRRWIQPQRQTTVYVEGR